MNRAGICHLLSAALILILICWPGMGAEQGPDPAASEPKTQAARRLTGLDFLEKGQRIKVEAKRLRNGKLVAEEIERVDEDDEFEVEGIAGSLDLEQMRFEIALFKIRMDNSTEFENSDRAPRAISDLFEGVRVKVKSKKQIEGVIEARSVRIYESSSDRDIELEARIEKLDPEKQEFSMLETAILVTEDTRYPNLQFVGGLPDGVDAGAMRGIRREGDEPDFAAFRLGPVYLGGRAGFAYERTRNYDLSENRKDSDDWLVPNGRLEVSLPFAENHELYTKLDFNRGWNVADDPLRTTRGDFAVKEAFVYLGRFLHPSFGLQIGRQRFRDRREWIYDDSLDAVRLHFEKSTFKLELSAARRIFAPTGSRSDQFYLIGWADKRFSGRRSLSGYWIKRNDLTGRDEDPIWFGLQSRGRITRDLSYWGELSRMMGRRGPRTLRGFGLDAGVAYRFRVPMEPTVSASYAFGSGDGNPKDNVDNNFRQTGLNDNNSRINGLKRYTYYGLLTEPELSNLKIQTLDVGLRPSRRLSVNFVYHAYRQSVASRDLGDIEINARPNGRDPRLGREFDVAFAVRPFDKLDIALFMGVFAPGPAFSGERPNAFLFRPALLFYF